jgi:hypothetical protein
LGGGAGRAYSEAMKVGFTCAARAISSPAAAA